MKSFINRYEELSFLEKEYILFAVNGFTDELAKLSKERKDLILIPR